MAIRKVIYRGSAVKVTGKFPSLKLGRPVWWERQIERDFIYLLEFDRDVLGYQEQPLQIKYQFEGKVHTYTPNFWIRKSHYELIVGIKPESVAEKGETESMFRSIARSCGEKGYQFRVVTDAVILTQPRLENIKLLWRYARTPLAPVHHLLGAEVFKRHENPTFVDADAFFRAGGATVNHLYALIYRGVIKFDLMTPLNTQTLLLPGGATALSRA